MGYIAHHAMVITSYRRDIIDAALVEAARLGMTTAGPVASPINGWHTLFIAPDGSNEGWDESDKGDEQRDTLIAWMRAQRYEDNSNSYQWAEVRYGSDDQAAEVSRHEWDDDPHEPDEEGA